jgi:hypothetical protein
MITNVMCCKKYLVVKSLRLLTYDLQLFFTFPDIYKFYTKNIEIVQNFIGLYQVKFVSFREMFVLSSNIDFLCSHF